MKLLQAFRIKPNDKKGLLRDTNIIGSWWSREWSFMTHRYTERMSSWLQKSLADGHAFPADGNAAGNGLGVWYAADVVAYHANTAELEVSHASCRCLYHCMV